MLLAAVVVELFSRKRTLAAGLLITSVCSAALMATPAQVTDTPQDFHGWQRRSLMF